MGLQNPVVPALGERALGPELWKSRVSLCHSLCQCVFSSTHCSTPPVTPVPSSGPQPLRSSWVKSTEPHSEDVELDQARLSPGPVTEPTAVKRRVGKPGCSPPALATSSQHGKGTTCAWRPRRHARVADIWRIYLIIRSSVR